MNMPTTIERATLDAIWTDLGSVIRWMIDHPYDSSVIPEISTVLNRHIELDAFLSDTIEITKDQRPMLITLNIENREVKLIIQDQIGNHHTTRIFHRF